MQEVAKPEWTKRASEERLANEMATYLQDCAEDKRRREEMQAQLRQRKEARIAGRSLVLRWADLWALRVGKGAFGGEEQLVLRAQHMLEAVKDAFLSQPAAADAEVCSSWKTGDSKTAVGRGGAARSWHNLAKCLLDEGRPWWGGSLGVLRRQGLGENGVLAELEERRQGLQLVLRELAAFDAAAEAHAAAQSAPVD